ncbi:hypothetical protein POM88_013580 [Heracleum sosnowskyi]|uniref:Uncharacterized protein n=1 Tax=Heracleum sosnowskyi TaxID=360622 RepID=A0AAD8IYS0_9APIA|nr:hypothetical protein POM88_013580 [Heracleum sosnowskyi]
MHNGESQIGFSYRYLWRALLSSAFLVVLVGLVWFLFCLIDGGFQMKMETTDFCDRKAGVLHGHFNVSKEEFDVLTSSFYELDQFLSKYVAYATLTLMFHDGGSGEDFSKDSIEHDKRRLTELGRRTIEIFMIVCKIEVAYQEAVVLKRQEELIREEEAAWLAETEQKLRCGTADKEKRSKKKQVH